MEAAQRQAILGRYRGRSRLFDQLAARQSRNDAQLIPFPPGYGSVVEELTKRETEVLQLIADGLANREIGERLYISEETIKTHVRHLLAKLPARSRTHAVALGLRRDIIT